MLLHILQILVLTMYLFVFSFALFTVTSIVTGLIKVINLERRGG